ncbi:GLPGLI family protein [Flavobacterium sp. W20_MBD1_R3]|uniref:GLPGLI family protein n=1 Tax=Flavobacterium sp. W20_MBD1_R3 TaxID=3240278 RepID=UPI003F9332D0
MKKYIFIFISCYCFSQNNKVTYEFIRKINDLEFKANGILNINKNITTFNLSQYKNLLNNGDKLIDVKTNDSTTVISSGNICFEDKLYYYDFKKDSITSLLYDVSCNSKVLVKDKIVYPKWDILDEYKVISGYKSQKATAFINDRTWSVFFTNELKISCGPWRLIGLPGVVLEAYENTNIYTFKLAKIEKTNEILNEPKLDKKSTFNEFVEKAVKQKQNELTFMFSQMGDETSEPVDLKDFPLYETLEFIEKRETKNNE